MATLPFWVRARLTVPAGTARKNRAVPIGLGALALGGAAIVAAPVTATAAVVTGTVIGVIALLWPSDTTDSALYTEDQLRDLKQARTRVRLRVEQQADGSLKGYGFYTGKHPEWEMVDVIQFSQRGTTACLNQRYYLAFYN